MRVLKASLLLLAVAATAATMAVAQPTVRVEPAHLETQRPLADETAKAAIRDYLESWQSMDAALEQNRPDLLDADFVGDARDKLSETIQEQAKLGIRTHYEDRAHDVQIVFYSPEGLSIELIDTVDYDTQLLDHDKPQAKQQVHARYIVVLTPAELRWRVRVLQAQTE
ncbi:MAG TPA: hypothetical protein VL991_04775 [Terracidiphilus sp.]|nr:hypothetical protein [Terracidiphilus sp.]